MTRSSLAFPIYVSLLLFAFADRLSAYDRSVGVQNVKQESSKVWVWCGLRGGTDTAYVGDVRARYGTTKSRIWSYSSRFVRVVNSNYGERVGNFGGVCRSFPSEDQASRSLSRFKSELAREARRTTLIEIF